jgi:hypothetical protein
MEEKIFEKIKGFNLQKLQEKFIELYIRYYNLKNENNIDINIDDNLIKFYFKKVKESNFDKNKKLNLRKIILELEETKSPYLFNYLNSLNIFK